MSDDLRDVEGPDAVGLALNWESQLQDFVFLAITTFLGQATNVSSVCQGQKLRDKRPG